MKEQKKDILNRLHELNALQQKTQAVEQKILDSVTLRLDVVNTELLKLRSRVITDERAAKQYHNLILERGHLNQMIAGSLA